MADQIFIGNFGKGLNLDREPFNIDNDAFPTLYNFYSWRGRIKRKRGTEPLARLERQIESVVTPNFNTEPWVFGPLTLSGGAGNLITGPWTTNLTTMYELESTASIAPGSINFTVGGNVYTEPATPDGTLVGTPAGSGTINYATGEVTIVGGGSDTLTGTFSYYPDLAVIGLEDFVTNNASDFFPVLLAFDNSYSYQVNQTVTPVNFYNTTYYKNSNVPFVWTADDSHLFWTTNYQSALWATNNKPGLHYVNATYISGSGTNAITFNFKSASVNFTNLVVNDVIFFNEWTASGVTINLLQGTITNATGAASGNYVVTFVANQTVSGTGIAFLLTNSIPGQDGIRWYDGDPTAHNGIPAETGLGWVNFSPPLTNFTVSINDQVPKLYYLVGALSIVPFKDRILFFAPQIQAVGGSVIQRALQDVVIWSWNGTPYYTPATATTTLGVTVYTPGLVPTNSSGSESSDPTGYFVDLTGRGGWGAAGISQPIISVSSNEDVLLVGFGNRGKKARFVYTSDDLDPFYFYLINNELPSSSTFSSISMDKGAIDIGTLGITMTTQQSCNRIDLEIPDSVFQIQTLNNGLLRVNAIRDFFREWIYFAYPYTGSRWKYPTQTFLLNYRDNTWAIFYENFTRHGNYRQQMKNTWATIGAKFGTWAAWREPWNAGSSQANFPSIIAGTPQGFVVVKSQGTNEAPTGSIATIVDDGFGFSEITSYNHCVAVGDYLLFLGALGTTAINNVIGQVTGVPNANEFIVDIPTPAGVYLGLGTFTRLSQPLFQTKQFPVYWQEGRKVRLGVQKYLLDFTADAQATLNIYLSQDVTNAYNMGPIIPSEGVTNNALVYSQILYTCPENPTGIPGLTPANTNLQMPTANEQNQIWHRVNTSLIGDTFQVGITLNDTQMRNLTYATSEITLHGIIFKVDRGPELA